MHEDARANAEGASATRVPSAHTDECNRLFAEFQASVIGQGERAPAADDRGCECETRECETRECEGCGLYKPIEEMSTVFLPGTGESYQCETCRGYGVGNG